MSANIYTTDDTLEDLITSPLTLTASWQSLGNLVNVKGLCDVAMWLKGSINDSDKISIRLRCKRTENDTNDYFSQIQTIGASAVTLSPETYDIILDPNVVVPLGISKLTPYVQLEIKVTTAGATPAELSEATLSVHRR